MATVEMIQQPSFVAVACARAATLRTTAANSAQAAVLGLSAVAVRDRAVPGVGRTAATGRISKINFESTTTGAMGKGAAAPITEGLAASVTREHQLQIQIDMVKGGYARGVPPRGRPV